MSKITLEGNASGTGTFTIAAPNSNTSYTLTLPTATGTILTSGGSQTIEFAAGSASTPSITFTGDTNTGIFSPAADTIAFTEGGTEVARFDSSGNLGIGTTSPATLLNLDRSNVAFRGQLTINGGSGGLAHLTLYNGSTTATNLTGNLYSSSDNIGVHLNAYQATGYIAFETNNFTQRMRIASDGAVRIAMQDYAAQPSSTNYGVSINNTSAGSRFYGGGTGTETQIEFGNTNGTRGSIQTNATNTLYNTTSDYRLKENVVPMVNALATVSALKPCTYTWKVDGSAGQGFIAHELAEVVPDCVTGEKDAIDEDGNIKPQFVDTSFLVATLTAAIQELKAINDAQATRIETLETKVAALEAK